MGEGEGDEKHKENERVSTVYEVACDDRLSLALFRIQECYCMSPW